MEDNIQTIINSSIKELWVVGGGYVDFIECDNSTLNTTFRLNHTTILTQKAYQ